MKDDNGQEIKLGDVLSSEDGYFVIVRRDSHSGKLYGQLVCKPGHSCERIPYALNGGEGYVKLVDTSATEEEKVRVPRLITVRWKETGSSESPTRISVSFLSVDFDEDDIAALSSYDEKSVVAAVKSHREREVNRTVKMKDIEVEMRY